VSHFSVLQNATSSDLAQAGFIFTPVQQLKKMIGSLHMVALGGSGTPF
jgi:hypothetical protein